MSDFGRLQGTTVAITGASRGIGKETAKLLGRLGANLILGSRSEADLIALSSEIDAPTLHVALDVTDQESVSLFAQKAISRFGKIDALINCAGTGVFADMLNLSLEDFDSMLQVNLKGTFLCCQYFGRHMVRNREGKILNVVSISGTTALPGCAGYSASKFGVLGLTRVIQAELRGQGIQVTAVLPGAVNTPFWDSLEHKPNVQDMIPAETLAEHLAYLLCQPKGAVIDEITILPQLGIL